MRRDIGKEREWRKKGTKKGETWYIIEKASHRYLSGHLAAPASQELVICNLQESTEGWDVLRK